MAALSKGNVLMSLAVVAVIAATEPLLSLFADRAPAAVPVTVPGIGTPTADQQTAKPDPALVAKGDSVFHGRLGGAICHVCHGQNAKGMPGMGPDLTDGKWLHSDGSLAAIEATIRSGVPKPKVSSTVMPPGGGVPLDSIRIRAVAAYVLSLNPRK